MPENALEGIAGVRLEPLCSLHLNVSFGYEVLSLLAPGVNTEHFFRIITPDKSVALFIHQVRFIRTLFNSGIYTFNLPAGVLVSERLFKSVCTELISGCVIEIQDPETIMFMGGAERRLLINNILDMKKRGVDIWLDDITPEMVDFFLALKLPVEGVKTDRKVLDQIPENGDGLRLFVKKCTRLAPLVVVEGIETEQMKYRAQNAGALAGQGFLWPERSYLYLQ